MVMKKVEKINKIFVFFLPLLFLAQIVFGASLEIRTDKTNYDSDEKINLEINISGEVDNGQVAISGLNNFDIVGRSSSQSFQFINGKTKNELSQSLLLLPKTSGKIKLQAVAYENGQEVKSNAIFLNIKPSLKQQTKQQLLNSLKGNNLIQSQNSQNNQNSQNLQNSQNKENQKNNLKQLLLTSQNPTVDNKQGSVEKN